jgi:hypothetical protein
MINNAQSRTKDMQTRMEVAWNRERSEQKRLLTEAHYLAIDLQKQLKYRDDEHLQACHFHSSLHVFCSRLGIIDHSKSLLKLKHIYNR